MRRGNGAAMIEGSGADRSAGRRVTVRRKPRMPVGTQTEQKTMKTTQNPSKRSGFTLIEMVGVLAVIAILAALLVPKIFSAIEESKYNNTVGSVNNLKAATMAYFAKSSMFPATTNFSSVLITAGELERPFTAKLGDGWNCSAVVSTAAGVGTGNRFSKLDGGALAASGTVVQCVLTNVPAADAFELSKRIDGVDMSAAGNTADTFTTNDAAVDNADDEGRVTYAVPDADKKTTVYIYIAHK